MIVVGLRVARPLHACQARVLPHLPLPQWGLTLPPRVRCLAAWDHALCRAMVQVYVRAVLVWLRGRARRRGVAGGRGGAVAIVQRFGSALNLNVQNGDAVDSGGP